MHVERIQLVVISLVIKDANVITTALLLPVLSLLLPHLS
jgi:hypothetical protein